MLGGEILFFPSWQNEGKQKKKKIHSQLTFWKLTETKSRWPRAHCTPELFWMRVFFSLSLSSEIAAGILSKDTNNHQLITTVRFCHRGVKVCCRYGPGGRVILWLLEVTPCLHPDVSCFFCALFFFFFWKGLLVDKQGNLKHEVYVRWSGLKGRWMSCFLFGFQSRQSIFLACGEWRAANSERSCCWRCICSGSLRCPCRGTPVQITTMVSLQKCAWVTVTFIYFIFYFKAILQCESKHKTKLVFSKTLIDVKRLWVLILQNSVI